MTPSEDEQIVEIMRTAGGMIPGGWDQVRSRGAINGKWMLGVFPAYDLLSLVFVAHDPDAYVPYAEILQNEIREVRKVKSGLNLAVNISWGDEFACTMVGPRKRVKQIMKQLGYLV